MQWRWVKCVGVKINYGRSDGQIWLRRNENGVLLHADPDDALPPLPVADAPKAPARQRGQVPPGYRPGKSTADYLDYVLTRITVVGALYLALVCLVPESVMASTGIGMALGGTSLLILVNVTIDTVTQIQSHLLAHQYADLVKKANLKGNKGKPRLR